MFINNNKWNNVHECRFETKSRLIGKIYGSIMSFDSWHTKYIFIRFEVEYCMFNSDKYMSKDLAYISDHGNKSIQSI